MILVLQLSITLSLATLYPKDKKSKQQKKKTDDVVDTKLTSQKGPVSETVYERNLVVGQPYAADIVANYETYYANTKLKHFNGTTLAYVTPVR